MTNILQSKDLSSIKDKDGIILLDHRQHEGGHFNTHSQSKDSIVAQVYASSTFCFHIYGVPKSGKNI